MPAPRNKVILRGSLGTQELWSVNLTYIGNDDGIVNDQGALQQWADDIAVSLQTTVSGEIEQCLGSQNTVDEVAVLAYGSAEPLIAQAVAPVTGVTGTSSVTHPLPTCVVISLLTGLPGQSYRGRFYWPAIGAEVTGNGFLAGITSNDAIAAGMAELLTAIGDASSNAGGSRLAVYSPTLSVVTPVTAVSVGSVPDTQRRRRDDLIEQYAQSPMPFVN